MEVSLPGMSNDRFLVAPDVARDRAKEGAAANAVVRVDLTKAARAPCADDKQIHAATIFFVVGLPIPLARFRPQVLRELN